MYRSVVGNLLFIKNIIQNLTSFFLLSESQTSRAETGTSRGLGGGGGGSLPRSAAPPLDNDSSWGYDGGMEDDSESVMTDLLSPGGQTDAQTLACMLQVRRDRFKGTVSPGGQTDAQTLACMLQVKGLSHNKRSLHPADRRTRRRSPACCR